MRIPRMSIITAAVFFVMLFRLSAGPSSPDGARLSLIPANCPESAGRPPSVGTVCSGWHGLSIPDLRRHRVCLGSVEPPCCLALRPSSSPAGRRVRLGHR